MFMIWCRSSLIEVDQSIVSDHYYYVHRCSMVYLQYCLTLMLLLVGHYVAYALNDIDDKWYEYDDSYVRPISEAELEHVEAYVLFYKRRPVFQDEPMELDG